MNKTYRYILGLYGAEKYVEAFRHMLEQVCLDRGISFDLFCLREGLGSEEIQQYNDAENEVAGVYFSDGNGTSLSEGEGESIRALYELGCLVFPVVQGENADEELGDELLRKYHACTCRDDGSLPPELFTAIMQGLHLEHTSRKVFISYRRKDSQNIANKLREALVLRGYEVFLDVVNMPSGYDFQQKLMEQLNDADIVLFLHSENIDQSEWIEKEIIGAEVRGVTFVHLLWPSVADSHILHHITDFIRVEKLTEVAAGHLPEERELLIPDYETVCDKLETLRIRGLAARRRKLTTQWKEMLNQGKEVVKHIHPMDDTQVLSMESSQKKVMLCPSMPGSKTVFRYAHSAKNKRMAKSKLEALCYLDGYTEESRNYFQWLCRAAKIHVLPEAAETNPRLRIFLSASCPYGERAKQYPPNPLCIRQAICSLVRVFVPHSRIVFGGHPAVNPFVLQVAEGCGAMEHIDIYQSCYFEDKIHPKIRELSECGRVIWTPYDKTTSLADALEEMREQMLSGVYDAAFFIGGMNGVEDEFSLFREKHKGKPTFCLASTDGAAAILSRTHPWPESYCPDGAASKDYESVFRRILRALL